MEQPAVARVALQRVIAAYKLRLAEAAKRLGARDETWGRNETISLQDERRRLAGEGTYRLSPYPYPGLRSFNPQEGENFFGRERNVTDVQNRLVAARMVVVLGGSGSGKSSLLRAGLLPYLNTKRRIPGREGSWYKAEFRPRKDPLGELIDALVDQWLLPLLDLKLPPLAKAMGVPQEASKEQARQLLIDEMRVRFFDGTKAKPREAILAALLDLAHRQLDEYDRLASGGLRVPGPSLMLLLDQFEEVFRPEVPQEARASLLNLIVDLNRHLNGKAEKGGLFLAVTMRSEELHRCAEHRGLSDVINQSFYLLDLLDPGDPADRPDLHRAIVQPARNVFEDWGLEYDRSCPDAPFERDMPDWLLEGARQASKEVEHRPDQLPLLQHALQATWHGAMRRWSASGFRDDRVTIKRIDLPGQSGGEVESPDLASCLRARADKAAERAAEHFASSAQTSLDAGEKALRAAFRALARRDDRGTWARRFAEPDDMQAFMAADPALETTETNKSLQWQALHHALHDFVLRGYLSGGEGRPYDISHEALIRTWPKFDEWLREPQEVARALIRVLSEVDPKEFEKADDLRKMQLVLPDVAGKVLGGQRQLPEKWAEDQIAPALTKPAMQERWGGNAEGAVQKVVSFAAAANHLRRREEVAKRQREFQAKQGERELEQARALAKEQEKTLEQAHALAKEQEKTLEQTRALAKERKKTVRRTTAGLIAACFLAAAALWQAKYAYEQSSVARSNEREARLQGQLNEVTAIEASIGRLQAEAANWQAYASELERVARRQRAEGTKSEPQDRVAENNRNKITKATNQRNVLLSQARDLTDKRYRAIVKINDENKARWTGNISASERERVITDVVKFFNTLSSLNSTDSRAPAEFNAQSTLRMALYAAAAIPEGNQRLNEALRTAIDNFWQLNFFAPPTASQVWGMAVDPASGNQPRAAVGDDNGVVWLLDPLDPSVSDPSASLNLQKLSAAAGIVNGLAFSADGNWLAAAYRGVGSVVWNRKTETPICVPGRPDDGGGAYGVAFHGSTLAVAANDGAVHLWDVSQEECRQRHVFKVADVVYGVAFGPHQRLAAASGDGTVTIWEIDARDPDTPYRKFSTEDKSPAFAVAFSPEDGRTLAATAADGRGYLWDIETGKLTVLQSRGGTVGQVAFSPDGKWMVATAQPDGTAIVTDAHTYKEHWYLGGGGQGLFGVVFSPKSNYLLAGNNLDGVVGVWLMEPESSEKTRSDRSGLIEAGLQRMADMTLKLDECNQLRKMKIPIFEEANKETSGICQLPFLWPRPGRTSPAIAKTPISADLVPSTSSESEEKPNKSDKPDK